LEKTRSWFEFFVFLIKFSSFILYKDSPSTPITKDDKQLTPANIFNSQQSQESNTNTGKIIESNKSIERQASQPASSSYTASQTHDEVRYE
jgi:hypothetical protein